MFRCSFMNYYRVRRLLDDGASARDFIKCYVDARGGLYVCPIDFMVVGMFFIGYSRALIR